MPSPDPSAPSQASEEVWKLCERLTGRHDGPWAHGRGCGQCDLIIAVVDRVSRQALERAATKIEESARDGRAGLPMFSAVRAGTLCQAASIVRALIPGEK